jgi:hypothetical protein
VSDQDPTTDDLVTERRQTAELVRQIREMGKLIRALRDDTGTSQAKLVQDVQQLTGAIAHLEEEQKECAERVERVYAAVFESNGDQDSVMSRVRQLERYRDGDITGHNPTVVAEPRGKWQFWMMIGPGIIALLGAAAALLKSYAGGAP